VIAYETKTEKLPLLHAGQDKKKNLLFIKALKRIYMLV